MPLHKLSDIFDDMYPPGTQRRREFEYYKRRAGRIFAITGIAYRLLAQIPPRSVGVAVAEFWTSILHGLLERFEARNSIDKTWSYPTIFYGALDGLAWRFFDDEYVPTWTDVKRGKAGKMRLVSRLRRRHAIEQAEAIAETVLAEKGQSTT